MVRILAAVLALPALAGVTACAALPAGLDRLETIFGEKVTHRVPG